MTAAEALREQKKSLRKKALQARRALTPAYRQEASAKMIAELWREPLFQQAKNVFLYASMPDEVQMYELMRQCLEADKVIALPQITGRRSMEAMAFSSLDDLEPGAYDILTVRQGRGKLLPADSLDCIIVPGAAFDAQGHRLGHGAGFYDIFMAERAPQAARIALTFDVLVCEQVPTEPHDVLVEQLITETRHFYCARKRR